jgi:pimeloyl-ACP methyl ester carboxylesterase
VLALEAANTLTDRVEQVVSFEAPVIVDGGRPPVPRDLPGRLEQLVEEGRRSKAVSTFNAEALRSPAAMTFAMRLMVPVWRQMTAMAQTTAYDALLCHGLQDGRPIPDERWAGISAPALVLVGGKSPRWAHTGAAEVADRLGARLELLPKAHHGSPTMQPQVIVPRLRDFLRSNKQSGA